jgi:hypothetical protein
MPSKTSPKTLVMALLILSTLVHTLCGDLHKPEDPAELMRSLGALFLIGAIALTMGTTQTLVGAFEREVRRDYRSLNGMNARSTTNYKCLGMPHLHL